MPLLGCLLGCPPPIRAPGFSSSASQCSFRHCAAGHATGSGSCTWVPGATWETRKEFHMLGLHMAQPWLWVMSQWMRSLPLSLSLILSFCLYTNKNTIVQTLKIVQLTNSGIPFHHASLPTGKFLLLWRILSALTVRKVWVKPHYVLCCVLDNPSYGMSSSKTILIM